MKNKKKKNLIQKDIDIECPICFEKTSDYITLNCNHKFCLHCIQTWLLSKYFDNPKVTCPYCREIMSKKIIKLVWENWVVINYKVDLFKKNNIFNITKALKISKISKIQYNMNMTFNNILIPLFCNKPGFLVSPIINDSNILHEDKFINLSHLLQFYKTQYNENIDKYNYILDGYITDKKWKGFLHKVNKNLKVQLNNNTDYNEKFNFSEYKIRFYISDINNITTIDNYYGFYDTKFHYLKNRKFKCLFKIFFIKGDCGLYLVNHLHSVIYN